MLEILKRLASGGELSVSQLFNEQTFGRAFCRDIKGARKTVAIESPYLTERRTRYFSPFFKEITKRRVRIRINTRHPRYHNQAMRIQAELAARILLASGVKIYISDNLRHRKLATIVTKSRGKVA